MFVPVFVVCCIGSGLCDELITRSEVSCRLCVSLCGLGTLKNEAALARFLENDIRKLGIVSWREVGRIRMDEDSNKGGVCPSWMVEPQEEEKEGKEKKGGEEEEEEKKKKKKKKKKKEEEEDEARFGLIRRWENMYRQETLTGGKEMVLRCLGVPRNILGFKRKECDAKWKKCIIKNLIICPLSLVIKAL